MENIKQTVCSKYYIIAIILILFKTSIFQYPLAFAKKISSVFNYMDYFYYVVIAVLLMMCASYIVGKIMASDIVFLMVVCTVILITYLFSSWNESFISSIISNFLVAVFPFYFLGVIFDINVCYKKHTLWNYTEILSKLAVVIALMYAFYYLSTSRVFTQDNMTAAYAILPFSILCTYSALKKGGGLNWLFAIIGFVYLLAMGTRGTIVCELFFVFIYFIFIKKKTAAATAKSVLLILIVSIFLLVIDINSIWNFLGLLLEKFGFSSRIFEFLQNDNFVIESSGRDTIAQTILSLIKKKPLTGYGFLSVIVRNGYYSHNLALDLWAEYGLLFGSILLILLAILIIKALIITKNQHDLQAFILTLTSVGVVKLFLSGTYVNEPYLFLLIGLCVNVLRNNKNCEREKNNENTLAMQFRNTNSCRKRKY